jgi:hypothetical protein
MWQVLYTVYSQCEDRPPRRQGQVQVQKPAVTVEPDPQHIGETAGSHTPSGISRVCSIVGRSGQVEQIHLI